MFTNIRIYGGSTMDKIKRNERIGAMARILTAAPNHIFTLSHF